MGDAHQHIFAHTKPDALRIHAGSDRVDGLTFQSIGNPPGNIFTVAPTMRDGNLALLN